MKYALFSLLAALTFSAPALADGDTFEITIKEHKFSPDTVEVPAGKKIKLVVKNTDPGPEEFESNDFKRERLIKGGKQAVISIGPLKPGTYKFFGEFNPDTAQGKLIAK